MTNKCLQNAENDLELKNLKPSDILRNFPSQFSDAFFEFIQAIRTEKVLVEAIQYRILYLMKMQNYFIGSHFVSQQGVPLFIDHFKSRLQRVSLI